MDHKLHPWDLPDLPGRISGPLPQGESHNSSFVSMYLQAAPMGVFRYENLVPKRFFNSPENHRKLHPQGSSGYYYNYPERFHKSCNVCREDFAKLIGEVLSLLIDIDDSLTG